MKTFLRAGVGLMFSVLLFWFAAYRVNPADLASTLKVPGLTLCKWPIIWHFRGPHDHSTMIEPSAAERATPKAKLLPQPETEYSRQFAIHPGEPG
jgi:hypothetical protein